MKKQRAHEEEMADTRVEIDNGTVYEQLGYKDHKELATKAILVMEISSAIRSKKITQLKARTADNRYIDYQYLTHLACGLTIGPFVLTLYQCPKSLI